MFNKLITAIALALIPFAGWAQQAVGSWKVIKPYYDTHIYDANYSADRFIGYQMLETPSKLYYVSLGGLFSYDKDTNESYAYNSTNKLSDNYVCGLWYNYDKHYLVIAYQTGNIDILYDNGTVKNLPDIADAIMTSGKTIYDVAFDGDVMYVGTNFGLVKYNVPGQYVMESGNYGFPVSAIAVMGDNLVISIGNGNDIQPYGIKKSQSINTINNFTQLTWFSRWRSNIYPINDTQALYRHQDGIPWIITFNFDRMTANTGVALNGALAVDAISPTKDGKWMAYTLDGKKIYTFNADGTFTTTNLPEAIQGQKTYYWDSPAKAWTSSDKGIAQVDLTTTPMTVLSNYFRPTNYNQRRTAAFKPGKDGALYMHQLDLDRARGFEFHYHEAPINRYANGQFEILSPVDAMKDSRFDFAPNYFYDAMDMCPDPNDENTYYVAALWEGLIKMQKQADGKWNESYIYSAKNSPINVVTGTSYESATSVAIDNQGNLWITPYLLTASEINKYGNVFMLPAAKRNGATTKNDWVTLKIPEFVPTFETRSLVCKHPSNANIILFMSGFWNGNILVYDTKGTTTTSDDTYNVISKFIDQDGKTFESVIPFYDMVEDNDGHIWIATHSGILELSSARNALNSNVTVNRLKVPRNDGSGYADYLLDAVEVYGIAVDGANNKWVATKTGGLYHVAAEGNKVLEQFTTDNSPLLDNLVYTVQCVPNTNSVIMATEYGLMEYSSDTAPAAEDFSDVYAYPNPVRPDYTGWITIKGLMDNSQVKIADAYGNVFYNGVSEGGMITWDGCNRDGQRVRSGVYYVYASQSGEGISTQGAVTKILVVN